MAVNSIPTLPSSLCRTSSLSSISSDDTIISTESSTSTHSAEGASRRTRRRFTNVQLMMLEQLYHQNSHPTREQRETLAAQVNAETRSVTVWFQNKRQTERRTLHNATNLFTTAPFPTTSSSTLPSSRKTSSMSPPLGAPFPSRRSARPRALTATTRPHDAPPSIRRPSLDHVATRSERPHPQRTPPRRTPSSPALSLSTSSRSALWENMPSSPLQPTSPARASEAERALLDFHGHLVMGRVRRRRTLEWACAAARAHGPCEEEDADAGLVLDLGDTEDEMEVPEVKTPTSRRRAGGKENVGGSDKAAPEVAVVVKDGTPVVPGQRQAFDEDMMDAALALCGLGRK